MGPDQPNADTPPGRRSRPRRPVRSRVPLHRRLRQDPAAVRHWLVVVALAWLLAALVTSSLDRAAAARDRWGRTTVVWVAARPLRAGDPLRGALHARRWPAGLVPASVVRRPSDDQRAAAPIDAGTVLSDAMVVVNGALVKIN